MIAKIMLRSARSTLNHTYKESRTIILLIM